MVVHGAAAVPAAPQPLTVVADIVPADGVVGVYFWSSPGLGEALKSGNLRLGVRDAEGQELAGTTLVGGLLYYAVFRPEQAFPVGVPLTLRLSSRDGDELPLGGEWAGRPFMATDARGPDPPFPAGSIVVELEDLAQTITGCCEAACFDTYRRTGVRADLGAEIDAEAATTGQYVYAFAPEGEPARSWSIEPSSWVALPAAASVAPFEPCQALWAHALADDEERMLASTCVDEASLAPEREELPYLALHDELAFDVCAQPAPQLRMRWCEVNRDACAGNAAACPGYDLQCASFGVTTQAAAGSSAAPTPQRARAHDPGCAATPYRARSGVPAPLLLLALLTAARAGRCRRSRRPRCRRSGASGWESRGRGTRG